MKIVSWNICCDNGDPRGINELIATENPDILCLQEVSPAIQEELNLLSKEYPYSTTAIDHYNEGLFGLFGRTPAYLKILSRVPFAGEPFRRTHSRGIRTSLAQFRGWHECVEHHGVDIVHEETSIRIVNLHIGCAETPKRKRAQFERTVYHLDNAGDTLVVGDFNIIATPKLRHLPRYLWRRFVSRSHSIKDLLIGSEQHDFAQRFQELGLNDIFCNQVTHPDSGMSLDKILVPKNLVACCRYTVLEKMYGSDHRPLVVEF